MSLATLYGATQDTYLTLIRTCPLRPLRSEADSTKPSPFWMAWGALGDSYTHREPF